MNIIEEPHNAGRIIHGLAAGGDEKAMGSLYAFGRVLDLAGKEVVAEAVKDGAPKDIGVHLAGPIMAAYGNYIRDAVNPPLRDMLELSGMQFEKGVYRADRNPNLLGAAIMARDEALKQGKSIFH